jgi:hypothetical protein
MSDFIWKRAISFILAGHLKTSHFSGGRFGVRAPDGRQIPASAATTKQCVSERSSSSSPRLEPREYHLPWALSLFPWQPGEDDALPRPDTVVEPPGPDWPSR